MIREELLKLSKEELVDMLLRLQRPDKTSRTSSKPPSSDRKQRREDSKPGGAKPGHDGHSRALSENPDEFQDHQPTHCPHCLLPFAADAERKLIGEYDEIELPPVRPFVRRHRRYAINCQCCAQSTPAPLPAVVKGTPFGPRIHAQAIYLKSVQALSYERLRKAFLDMFGLVISEGAIMNMLRCCFSTTARAASGPPRRFMMRRWFLRTPCTLRMRRALPAAGRQRRKTWPSRRPLDGSASTFTARSISKPARPR
jgi:transposase